MIGDDRDKIEFIKDLSCSEYIRDILIKQEMVKYCMYLVISTEVKIHEFKKSISRIYNRVSKIFYRLSN